jgi:uncharacterized glyoxalase superfamily protein PhnB
LLIVCTSQFGIERLSARSPSDPSISFYPDISATGVLFSMPPKKQDFGAVLAQFVDSEGAHCSVGAEAA